MNPHRFLLLLITGLVLVHSAVSAQYYEERRLSYGLSFGSGFKTRIADPNGLRYQFWGDFAFGMYLAYRGPSTNSMAARIHAQPVRDDLYVRVGKNEAYFLERIGFLLNPEIAIPIRNSYGDSRLEAIVGIGGLFSDAGSFGIHNLNGSFGGSYLDQLADTFYRAHRKLVPFLTAGAAFRFHRRASFSIRLRQDVQNTFISGYEATLYSSTDVQTVKLRALPTRLLLGFMIRLGKMPELY